MLPAGLISDMESQLSEGGAGAAELAKAKKRLEQELEEVRTNMEVCVRYNYECLS